jgi:hypothetical protein
VGIVVGCLISLVPTGPTAMKRKPELFQRTELAVASDDAAVS